MPMTHQLREGHHLRGGVGELGWGAKGAKWSGKDLGIGVRPSTAARSALWVSAMQRVRVDGAGVSLLDGPLSLQSPLEPGRGARNPGALYSGHVGPVLAGPCWQECQA